MSTQVAGIEEASSASFNLQSVGIKSGMIDEMRRDGERANLQRLATFEVFPGLWCEAFWHEVGRRTHDALGSPAHYERDVGANLRNEPPMVAMSVGKNNCEQRRIMFAEARNLRNKCRVRFSRIERQAKINNYTTSRRLDLNAGAADLLGAAMDADPHAILPLGGLCVPLKS